jgi:hypothetical protein
MWHCSRGYDKAINLESLVGHWLIGDSRRQRIQLNRKNWWSDRAPHCFFKITVILFWRNNMHFGFFVQKRCEKWQALNVVPVQMGEQHIHICRLAMGQCAGEIAKSRTKIEDQRVFTGRSNNYARRIAAVASRFVTVTRR